MPFAARARVLQIWKASWRDFGAAVAFFVVVADGLWTLCDEGLCDDDEDLCDDLLPCEPLASAVELAPSASAIAMVIVRMCETLRIERLDVLDGFMPGPDAGRS